MSNPNITTIILTYNEELNIENCIASIKEISERIIVVDSYSTDKTIEIAQRLGAEVYQNKFINQAKQVIYALENLDIKSDWILRLDADERISFQASQEILNILEKDDLNINGIVIPFEVNFLGKKLRHGGIFPFKKMSMIRNGFGKMEDREMDEHFYLLSGDSIELKNLSEHRDYKNLTLWIDKHNKYANREVSDYFQQMTNNHNDAKHLSKSFKIKRFIKFKVYYKLPLGLRSWVYYLYRYYFKLGFLDGKEGKIFAFLQAYWYRFLVDAKIYEQQQKRNKNIE